MKRTLLSLSLSLALGAQDPSGVPSPVPDAVAGAASSAASPGAGSHVPRPSRSRKLDGAMDPFLLVSVASLPRPSNAGWWKRHLADSAIHGAATSLDAASSWGRREANPLLRSADGRFGARGLGIKLGIFAGVELVKWRLSKRYPRERWVRALSLGPAAAFGGVAVRNWSVR